MDDLASLQSTLASHIAQNNAKFAAYDSLISHLTTTGATTMADGPVDNVKIHNHAPATAADPTAALMPALLASMGKSGSDGGGLLGGSGGGLLGGLLLGSLLRNGGILGGGNAPVDGIVTPALLTSSLNQIQGNVDSAIAANERLQSSRADADAQREIQAAIERTNAATLLAISTGNAALGVETAKGFGEINTQVALTSGNTQTQNALTSASTQTLVQKTTGDLATQIATQTAALGVQTERTAAANALAVSLGQKEILQATAESKYQLAQAIKADGDQTRALIIAQNEANLNRQLATAQNEIIELRNDRGGVARARETEINVTQNVNQAQAQAQQQQQYQTLNGQIAQLLASHQYLQQGIVNLGTMTGSAGQQTAANTRVN